MTHRAFAILALSALLAGPAVAEPLGRPATLGVAIAAPPQGEGVLVQSVRWPDAARAFGLKPGDIILSIDGVSTPGPNALVEVLRAERPGAATRLQVRRDGRTATLSGKLASRPTETFANGSVRLGQVAFEGGQLREFFVTPPGGAKGPVLFILQGYTCDSVETTSDESSHRQLIDGLLKRGVSTYRVEKPGAGDSRGGRPCEDIDFDTELRAFDAGYRSLIETHGVSPDRIFLLGHSLGGIVAPFMAADGPAPRGVAVYGTVVRNWYDYMMDIARYQATIGGRSTDPAADEAAGEKLRGTLAKIYLEGQSPVDVAAKDPAAGEGLKKAFAWTGDSHIFERDYRFWSQLSNRSLIAAWRDTKSNVLSVFGESDLAALSDNDQRLLVDVVNQYRPGTARFVSVPGTGHGMKFEPLKAPAAGQTVPASVFNTDLIAIFGDWIEASMQAPPVAARSAAPAAAKE